MSKRAPRCTSKARHLLKIMLSTSQYTWGPLPLSPFLNPPHPGEKLTSKSACKAESVLWRWCTRSSSWFQKTFLLGSCMFAINLANFSYRSKGSFVRSYGGPRVFLCTVFTWIGSAEKWLHNRADFQLDKMGFFMVTVCQLSWLLLMLL